MNNLEECLSNRWWRLNNIYHIIDKSGSKIIFQPNWAQKTLYDNMWYMNIILKARQLGMSTFISILFLDCCLFNEDKSAGIIAHTMQDAEHMFRRVKFAYYNLPAIIQRNIIADTKTAQMLKFSNGSSMRVGTSLRSSTEQYLHISEFGKVCAKYPEKAREIITGSLNTLATGQYCFIESTAEGREGYFFDMCKQAETLRDAKKELSPLDFRFHFFPWHGEPHYRIGSNVSIGDTFTSYFASLKTLGIELDDQQRAWYVNKALTQKDDMKREYPSTAQECWETSNEGTYYASYITNARRESRICKISYEEALPVHTAWDLGYNNNSIWIFQVLGKEIRLLEYLEGSGTSLPQWIKELKERPYVYDKHLAPHDISVHEMGSGMSRISIARNHGLHFIKVPKIERISGIDQVKNILNNCWFNEKGCEQGIRSLENYRMEWDDNKGCWMKNPLHNWASHGADAFRILATGLHYITNVKSLAEVERERMHELRDASGQYPGSYLYTPENRNQGVPEYRKRNF